MLYNFLCILYVQVVDQYQYSNVEMQYTIKVRYRSLLLLYKYNYILCGAKPLDG